MSENAESIPAEEFSGQFIPLHPVPLEDSLPLARINTPVATLMSLSEMLPVNWAVFGSMEAVSGNHLINALSFAAATLVTETAGAIGSAQLIDRGKINRPIRWAHKKVSKLYSDGETSSPTTDFVFTVAAGTVALNVFKQVQDTERGRNQNIKYSTKMGIGNSAVSGVGIWLASEGIYHPDPANITLASIAALGILSSARILKRRLKRSHQHTDQE